VVALEEAMSCGKLIVLAAQKVAKVNEPSPDDIYTVGTVSAIKQLVRLPDGTIRVVVEGVERPLSWNMYIPTHATWSRLSLCQLWKYTTLNWRLLHVTRA